VLDAFGEPERKVSGGDLSGGNTACEISDAYEDNCVGLLVKSVYNGGDGLDISSSWRNRAKSKGCLPNSELTPDFFAHIPKHDKNDLPVFPPCLVPTTSNQPPLVCRDELSTPPPSPTTTPTKPPSSSSSVLVQTWVIFEFSQDVSKWREKLQQLEQYVSALPPNHPVRIVGVAFPSAAKFAAIQNELNRQNNNFPSLTTLHEEGRFFYLLCDETFVKSTHSKVSSSSQQVKRLEQLMLGVITALAGSQFG
jgi:hypothetical protein